MFQNYKSVVIFLVHNFITRYRYINLCIYIIFRYIIKVMYQLLTI